MTNTSYPQLLLIVRERVRPERQAAYNLNEREIARASATLGCPHPYLALTTDDRQDVWWLNLFASESEQREVSAAYTNNEPLMSALQPLSAAKQRLTESVVTTLTRCRPDLSGAGLTLDGAPFLTVRVTRGCQRSTAAVFESEDGQRFEIASASDRTTAEYLASQLGVGSQVLIVQRRWSFPAREVLIRVATSADSSAMAQCRLSDPDAGPPDPRVAAYFDGRHHPHRSLRPRVGFVALDAGTVVGYIAGHLTTRFEHQGEVQYLFVALEYRRQGLATTLLQHLAAWFRDHDAMRVCVDVNLDSPSAAPFYERLGARSFRPHWWGWEDINAVLPSPTV